MRFLEKMDEAASEGGGPVSRHWTLASATVHTRQLGTAHANNTQTHTQRSSISDDITSLSLSNTSHHSTASHDSISLISHPSSPLSSSVPKPSGEKKARLLYCKSHVVIHPTQFNKDNISGYLGIVEVDRAEGGLRSDEEGAVKREVGKELLVSWVPDEVLERMDEEDRAGYKRVEGRGTAQEDNTEEDGQFCLRVVASQ